MRGLAERIVDRALLAARDTPRQDALPLLATNLAVMLSRQRGADPIVVVVGADRSIGAKAFRHGARLYGRAQDDWYHRGRSHIGTGVLPAVLAAETDDVVPPMLAGFSAMMAVSAAYGVQAHTSGLRPTSMFAPVGASVAAAIAMGLDRSRIIDALSAALVGSCGHSACMLEGSDEWRYEVLLAIRAGAEAAWLAGHGATFVKRSFEGDSGWCRAHFDDPRGAKLAAVLDAPAEPIGAVSVKPFPASGVAMGTIATAIRAGIAVGDAEVRRLTLFVSPAVMAVPGSKGQAPFRTGIAAGMSLSRCCAEAFLTGSLAATIPPDRRGEIEALAARLELVADPALDDGTARVEAHTAAGVVSETGSAAAMLYPTWQQLLEDRHAPARYDVDVERFAEMIEIISREKVPSAALLGLMERSDA